MKALITLLFMIQISSLCLAQKVTFKEVNEAKNGSIRGTYQEYKSENGKIYIVGDTITIGRPSGSGESFKYISQGDGIITKLEQLPVSATGQQSEIIRLKVLGNKLTGYQMYFRTKGKDGITNYTVYAEPAISSGEIDGFTMTSEEALNKLRNAKEKLDLELISQEEYDSIKIYFHRFIE